ncbi:MAG: hypothetical protein SFX73_31610 [Kofleriaceae bacterium]|nr:hypothetical protein [Kofleriaceae bacterium]
MDERIGSIRDSVKSLVDRGEQRAHAFKSRVVEMSDSAKHRGGDALDRTSELIKAHPLKAVGIAFGVGYLTMRLFRRR